MTADAPKGRGLNARVAGELLIASRFAIVGIVATIVHMAIVWMLVSAATTPALLANGIAFACAFLVSFAGHHFWTFETGESVRQRFVRFLLISLTGLALNSVSLVLLLRAALFSPANSALLAAAIVPLLSFVASRVWGFRSP